MDQLLICWVNSHGSLPGFGPSVWFLQKFVLKLAQAYIRSSGCSWCSLRGLNSIFYILGSYTLPLATPPFPTTANLLRWPHKLVIWSAVMTGRGMEVCRRFWSESPALSFTSKCFQSLTCHVARYQLLLQWEFTRARPRWAGSPFIMRLVVSSGTFHDLRFIVRSLVR